VIDGRNYIYNEINRLPGLRAYPSEGNFVLIDASVLDKNSFEIRDWVAARGVFIRPMSGHHMQKGFIRITVGTPEQNRCLIEIFKDFIQEVMGKQENR
jgi:histidinol-phosphate aminotransferase